MAIQTTGVQVDPVCGMSVDPERASGTTHYGDQDYYFCSPGCKAKFDRNPDQYLGPGEKKGGCCCG